MRTPLILLILLLSPLVTYAQTFNAGIVKGLWYSSDTFLANETVRIYVAIRNNTGADLSGRVEFYDNDRLIERNNVSALDGRIIESWADWTPTAGTHTISATLSRIELSAVGSTTQAIEVISALAEDTIFVDIDSDNDGIGDETDKDDDGDGISDEVEIKNGTDPLKYNEPKTPSVDDNKNEKKEETDTSGADTATSSTAIGLERFLTPSPARTALTNITNTVNTTKRALDTYRTERANASDDSNVPPVVVVNDDGFGEITRTRADERTVRTPDIPTDGFIGSTFSFLRKTLSVGYTAVLAALSAFLGYVVLVQLLLLFGILFSIYKVARKFGARPR